RGPALPVQSDRYVSAALSDINKTCSSKSLQSLATDLCRPLRCFCSDDRGEKFIGSYSIGEPEMARTKQASKRNRRSKAVPVLGAAGLSLSLATGASASTSGPAADVTPQSTPPNHEIFLGDEEISDVSLSTFYVFDKENIAQPQLGQKVAA